MFGVGRLSANLILCGNNCTVYLGGGGGPFFFLFSTGSRNGLSLSCSSSKPPVLMFHICFSFICCGFTESHHSQQLLLGRRDEVRHIDDGDVPGSAEYRGGICFWIQQLHSIKHQLLSLLLLFLGLSAFVFLWICHEVLKILMNKKKKSTQASY